MNRTAQVAELNSLEPSLAQRWPQRNAPGPDILRRRPAAGAEAPLVVLVAIVAAMLGGRTEDNVSGVRKLELVMR